MPDLAGGRLRHTVAFALRHPPGSPEEADFLATAAELASIPVVESFEVLRVVSAKGGYGFALSMEFADEAAYAAYNENPEHLAFVRGRWVPEVTEFLELDSMLYEA